MKVKDTLLALGIVLLMVTISSPAAAQTWPNNSTMHGPDFSWSGRTWWAMDWSAYDPDYVWIDGNGWLHLVQSGYVDSGIISYQPCGYGNYTWVMAGVHQIHPNGVIGMYPYLSDLGVEENWHEADIEQAMWGDPDGSNYDFWVQPNSANTHLLFSLDYTNADVTFRIDWERSYIAFAVIEGGHVIESWRADQVRDATGVYACANFWHYLKPTSGQAEAVFKSFAYSPAGVTTTPQADQNQGGGTTSDGDRPINQTSGDHVLVLPGPLSITNTSTVPSLSLPWYYLAIGGGVVLAIASGIARRWAILLIAIGLIA
ncbi:MAG TPA: hypothetical protein VGK23_09820, partial [Methanomassiliicoccales archaeon]